MTEPSTSNSKRRNSKSKATSDKGPGKTKKKVKFHDPLRNDHYKDPLQQEVIQYKTEFKMPEFRPYDTYHEYVMPDIDPLTGKPRTRRPKPAKKTEPVTSGSEPESTKESELHPTLFKGKSIGSIQRTMRIAEAIDF